ncbi:hypothetical protein CB172_22880 [Salmonella enterica subsp. enterica serovar Claibornei]|nr:hypothetical protein [Salmonella enterica subsp. enterica serovar Claibornei]
MLHRGSACSLRSSWFSEREKERFNRNLIHAFSLDNYYKKCDDDMPAVAGKAFSDDEVDSNEPEISNGKRK